MKRIWKQQLNADYYMLERESIAKKNLDTVEKVAVIYSVLLTIFGVIMHCLMRNRKLDLLYLISVPTLVVVSAVFIIIMEQKKQNPRWSYIGCKVYRCFCISFVFIVSIYPFPEKPAIYFSSAMVFCSIVLVYPLYDTIIAMTVYELIFILMTCLVKWKYPDNIQYDFFSTIAGYAIALSSSFLMNRLRVSEYEANRAKEEFLSRMSHDIRTPLNGVLGLTALAIDEVENTQQVRDYLYKIDASGQYLLSLVNDVLDMVKINSGKLVFHNERYSQREFVETMDAVFGSVCRGKNIHFIIERMDHSEDIVIDKLRFNQIVFNLISNAVKFTPPGGTVRYKVLERSRESENREKIVFLVEDSGCGMSEEFQKHLFESFSQEKSLGDSQKDSGTGLGLAIVKHLVDQMGGKIRVKSELGNGTKFEVTLYVKVSHGIDKKMAENSQTNLRPESQLAGKHVMVVEDNSINAEITQKLLQKKGVVVAGAENGQIALDLMRDSAEQDYDAILMDIRMPVMDGLEASRKIRELDRRDANLPIIALTANAFEEDIEAAKNAGIQYHLQKPVQPQLLFETLQLALQEAEQGVRA